MVSNPVTVDILTPIAPDLFVLQSSPEDVRTTVVRLPDGGLWVHAPPAWSPALHEVLSTVGAVAHLVAVTPEQAAQLNSWVAQVDGVRCWAAASVVDATLDAGHPMPPVSPLDARADWWSHTIECRTARGNAHEEALFLHLPSRALIVGGLLETRHPGAVPGLVQWTARVTGRPPALAGTPVSMQLRFFGQRRTLASLVRWARSTEPSRVVPMRGALLDAPSDLLLGAGWEWVGADGPIPPMMRFALGANPGGAVAFFVALATVSGLLLGLELPAPSGISRFATALVMADILGGLVAMASPETRRWWRTRGRAWIAGSLGIHVMHPLALVAAHDGSVGWALGLWMLAMVGGMLVWLWPDRRGALPLAMFLVGFGTIFFSADAAGPVWFASVYLLKLVGCFSYGTRADLEE
ncbi:MAG TPA: hypothetical protein DFR83_06140 [Deltaproteobacteria bacterium]|nr:hypothetical protein [Deltaproteobacteria bacterium]